MRGRQGNYLCQKPFFTRPARDEALKALMTQTDAVVTGAGE